MKPTRVSTLVIVAVVCAVAGWLLLRAVYAKLPPLPWTGVPALLIAAVAEAWMGRDLKARIAGRARLSRTQGGQQGGDGPAAGQAGLRVDVEPRREDEGAFVRARVRQGEHRVAADFPGEADDVDVEGTRTEPFGPSGPYPAEVRLDALGPGQQVPRLQAGRDDQHRVQVVGLGRAADRGGLVDG